MPNSGAENDEEKCTRMGGWRAGETKKRIILVAAIQLATQTLAQGAHQEPTILCWSVLVEGGPRLHEDARKTLERCAADAAKEHCERK